MRIRDYFPLGIAFGAAFCNRKLETKTLNENIKNGKHTLLMATRRYGKSSLALHSLKECQFPYVEIDFYMVTHEKMIEAYILRAIADLIGKTVGPIEKWMNSIKSYIKNLKPKIDIGNSTFKLELISEIESDPATNIKEGLLLLEKLLCESKKQAVILMDEFQNIGSIAKGKGIEGAIRHVAQKTNYLTLIFSGSNRKLLKTMFEDETRPLYKLCWKIDLKRICATDYQKHIQKAAQSAWKKPLNVEALEKILFLTERHPFYLNKLCDKVFSYYPTQPPLIKNIEEAWHSILEEEKSDAIKEISLLSLGQKNVLLKVAKGDHVPLTSKQSMFELNMSSSSIVTALEGLEEKDVIEKIDHQYQVINPIVKFYVLKK